MENVDNNNLITKTWWGEEGNGDADVARDLVASQHHPGQIEEPHLGEETLRSHLQFKICNGVVCGVCCGPREVFIQFAHLVTQVIYS